ncbi:hypothetical protein [uncultured Jannaschia sp.]|uniref:hypothetical protein n=1 Tax=uncultured Jannaschia sp. TaxID=293347 RepID=UPI0026228942|nr:hypothetical protein [uncultured Jannaschia sp.]
MTGVLTLLAVLTVGFAIGLGLGAFVFGVLLRRDLGDLRDTLDARARARVCRFDRIPPLDPVDMLAPATVIPLRGTIGEGDRA